MLTRQPAREETFTEIEKSIRTEWRYAGLDMNYLRIYLSRWDSYLMLLLCKTVHQLKSTSCWYQNAGAGALFLLRQQYPAPAPPRHNTL